MAKIDEEFLQSVKDSFPSEADLQSRAAKIDEEFLQLVKASLPSEADLQGATVEGVAQAAGEFATPPSVSQRGRPLPLGAVEDDPRLTDHLFFTQFQRQDEFGGKIKLDTQTGAPLMTRLKLGLTDDPETQQRIIQNTFQGVTVDRVPGNNLIIRGLSDEETGEEYDLLVDEVGASKKDFADLSSVLLEVVGAGVGAALAKNPVGARAGKVLGARAGTAVANIVGGVGGAAAGRSASEALVGGDPTPDAGEIGTDLALDTLLTAVPFGVGKMIDKVATGARGKIQRDALEAQLRIKDSTGIDIPLSTGEATGRPTIQRLEGVIEKTPGGQGAQQQLADLSRDRIRAVQKKLFEGDTPISRENVNGRAIKALSDAVEAGDTGLLAQQIQLVRDSSQAIKGILDAATPRAGGSVVKSAAGEATREAVDTIHKGFKARAEALYAPVLRVNPKFNILQVREVIKQSQKALLRTADEIEIIESKLVDKFGKPLITSEVKKGGKIIKGQLAREYRKFVSELKQTPDDIPLDQLRRLNTRVNDAISDSRILLKRDDLDLIRLSQSLRDAIEKGAEQLPSGNLKAQLDRANNFYRSNLPRFQTQGIEELLADPTQRRIDNFQVVNQAIESPGQFFRLKEALTKDLVDGGVNNASVEAGRDAFDTLKRSMLAVMTDDSLAGPSVIDIADFAARVGRLEPEVGDELLGPRLRQALKQASKQKVLEADVPAGKMLELFSRENVSSADLAKLVRETQKENQLYKNTIIKRLVKDKVSPDEVVRSDEFVDKFLDVGSIQEVREVLDILGQDQKLLEDIRRLTIQRVLHRTAKTTTSEEVREELAGEASRIFKADKMAKLLGDEIQGGKLKAVIGEDAFNVLKDLTFIQAVKDQKESAVQAAGGLIGGSLLSQMILKPLLSLPKNAGYAFASWALANPSTRAIMMRLDPKEAIPFGRAVVTAEPFIRSLFVDMPADAAELALAELQQAFYVEQDEVSEEGLDEEFLQLLDQAFPE